MTHFSISKFMTSAAVLALITGANMGLAPSAYADDCLLDTNNDGDADSNIDTDGGADSSGNIFSLACGVGATATGGDSTALGRDATASGDHSAAVGRDSLASGLEASAYGKDSSATGIRSTALGYFATASGEGSTSVGQFATSTGVNSTALGRFTGTTGDNSTALGATSNAAASSVSVGHAANSASNAIAIGADSADIDGSGANASGDSSIVIGTDASDGSFNNTIVVGRGAVAIEPFQVILGDPFTFNIRGNGDVGLGTDTPAGNLDIDSGETDTLLLLTNATAQWSIKSNATNGKLTIGNNTTGAKPFKFGPNAIGNLLQVGIVATDQVDIKGNLVMTGTLVTGGPTCGGGCDAVFGADYDMPSIEEHAAQMYANSYLPEIGATIPHAPVNLSEQYGKVINELEKAHIYIAQINAEKQALALENPAAKYPSGTA